MPLIWSILALVLGTLLLASAVHLRCGRHWTAREWAAKPWDTSTSVLLLLPSAGLLFLAIGLVRWAPTSGPAALGFVVAALLGTLLGLWGGFFRVPLALVPAWAREKVAKRRQRTR